MEATERAPRSVREELRRDLVGRCELEEVSPAPPVSQHHLGPAPRGELGGVAIDLEGEALQDRLVGEGGPNVRAQVVDGLGEGVPNEGLSDARHSVDA